MTVLLIFFLFQEILGSWEKPLLLRYAYMKYTHGMFIESTNGSTYVFFGKNLWDGYEIISHVCFEKYSYEDKVIKNNCVFQERSIGNLSAVGNGDSLYVVYDAKRKKNEWNCSASNSDGCSDIYFLESSDGGETWTDPIKIPRSPDEDYYHRYNPSLVLLEDTNRLFVTYQIDYQDEAQIKFSTRPNGSLIFRKEELVIKETSFGYQDLRFLYRKTGKGRELQLYYRYKGYLQFVFSRDNGISWEKSAFSHFGNYAVATSEDCEKIFLVVSNPNQFSIFWQNRDLSWHSREYTQTIQSTQFAPFLAKVPGDPSKILFTAFISSSFSNTFIFDTDSEKLLYLDEEAIPIGSLSSVCISHRGHRKARMLFPFAYNTYMLSYTFPDNFEILNNCLEKEIEGKDEYSVEEILRRRTNKI